MGESDTTPRIALCMIVKNEAAILRRCLESTLPIISAACLCDTGSSDGTCDLADEILTAAGLPHALPSHEWINFGVNRSQSFAATQAFARTLGWDLDRSYALFLDADMLLDIDPSFDPTTLDAGGYLLQQQDGTLVYANLRLARLSLDWRCVGVTHEYWTADDAGELPVLDTLSITHIGDGGAKADKFSRDIALLEAELGSVQNLRTAFYLARSYEDTGRFQEAHRLYEWRASGGGWEEEAWYAAYRMGLCSIGLGNWEKAVVELLSAWGRRPQRAEPLYQLSHAARERSESQLAMLFAERAQRIPLPKDDQLFVDTWAYHFGPLEEISISAYYTGDKQLGMAASDTLLHSRAAPPASRDLAGRNAAYYAQQLPAAWSIPIQITDDFDAPGFSPGNTTICGTDDGYLVIVRLVNYAQHGAVWFVAHDPEGRFRSKNVHLLLDADFQILSSLEIDETFVARVQPEYAPHAMVQGIEDLRLTRWRGDSWFTATSCMFDPMGHPRVILGKLDSSASSVEHLVPLDFAGRQLDEKNWLPFVHEDRLLLLYACDPMVILEPDLETGYCQEIHRAIPELCFDRYRGSASPIEYGERYLFTVHEVTIIDQKRVYLHRFVEMDRSFRITRISRLFTIWHLGVEYNCGICLSHDGKSLLLTASWEDRLSCIINVPLAEVEAMLLPVSEVGGVANVEPAVQSDAGVRSQITPVHVS